MTRRGKSIIITTHYIQEARQAHTVCAISTTIITVRWENFILYLSFQIGLMRGGVLLAEEAPLQLMEKCGCSDLEEAFLTLSHKQEAKPKAVVRNSRAIFSLPPHTCTYVYYTFQPQYLSLFGRN